MNKHTLAWHDGWLCMRSESTLSSEPTTIVSFYPIVPASRADVETLFDRTVRYRYLEDGDFMGVDLHGKALTVHLKDGGATLPLHTDQMPVRPPRCRVQTRWHIGRWEKYLTREGWVLA